MKQNVKIILRFARHYWQFSFAAVGAILGLILQLFGQTTPAHIVLALPAITLVFPMAWGMIREFREGTYGVDILAITAIVTAVLMKEYWAGMVVVLMLTGGEALEDYAENRAKREMTALLNNAPRIAHLVRGQKESDVAVATIKKGDKIVIRAGEMVPVDAVIMRGEASFDEASITGESLPELRRMHDEILSGAVNLDGAIMAKALRAAADSQYEQIIKLVRSAARSKAPFVRMADRFAVPFTLVAFAIAIGAWIFSGDSLRFLQVMVVATPCPLILAAPIAIISGMSRASKVGVIVKNGTALERIATAKSFAFDKTGTLTHGRLRVAAVETIGKNTVSDVLTIAAALSKNSNHITSLAVTNEALKRKLQLAVVTEQKELAGKGIQGVVGKKKVLFGRVSFLREHGVEIEQKLENKAESQTSSLVAVQGKVIGFIQYEDEVRSDAKPTLEYLHAHGVLNTYLLTGDNEKTALAVANEVGIAKADVVAGALPIDKLRTVEQIAAPPVAYVGDGVNDAPVLTAADVGIALGAKGSTAASESADVVIMQDSFARVADIHRIARRTFKIARQSILIGIGLSIVLMGVFATGKFSPVLGAAVQELVDVVVIFNALRAHVAGRQI